MKEVIRIHEEDNVAVALRDFLAQENLMVDGKEFSLKEEVKLGHKIALTPISAGGNIIKYGFPIGHATHSISPGEWVHTHNTKTNLNNVNEYEFHQKLAVPKQKKQALTFKGYRRKNGDIGIRNELWIIPTVGCVNGIAEQMIKQFQKEIGDISPFEHVTVLKHNYGCSQLGDDHLNTRTMLTRMVQHPNAGGVLVLGLGCENNSLTEFKQALGTIDESRVKFLQSQDVEDEIEAGVNLLKEIYAVAKDDKREDVDISRLKVGLKCGGSDGLSGITANPLLGKFSDWLIAQGGTTVLTEVPEMFGAETLLMERAVDEQTFDKIVHLVNDFKTYFLNHKQPVYENPSPGNKAGGITTLEDKSLGCTQKAGTAPVVDVLNYGDRLQTNGLNLLSAPGNDLVASTALGASGCHIVLFTTGRGTPFGTFVPTIKISTNTALYNKKPHWIDFNGGVLIEGDTEEATLESFIEYMISVSSGELVNNEKNDFREIAIFKTGVTL
ncbi:altronate dehydratase family protein [Priestia sp. Y58]|uniref:UxaA family hydrolase n=1 Tax=Priestia TaxID=2800373 RepID=UPI001C8E2DE1|nr:MULTISPECIES: altronate dehydratase family protein [Priestia]MBX9987194.1 altronate dehydratase [Priestia aryabhattai]MBX9998935.1 altronate dehydratase [Priestia aryabhattai]MDG0029936.1 altronate dehydratase family protein [Priestia sp. Y58]MDG0060006.1 altronate dehydratase family protein [Priestia sp. P5]UYV54820.1 altronate dehydratase family protein [Priestia megaterium]